MLWNTTVAQCTAVRWSLGPHHVGTAPEASVGIVTDRPTDVSEDGKRGGQAIPLATTMIRHDDRICAIVNGGPGIVRRDHSLRCWWVDRRCQSRMIAYM